MVGAPCWWFSHTPWTSTGSLYIRGRSKSSSSTWSRSSTNTPSLSWTPSGSLYIQRRSECSTVVVVDVAVLEVEVILVLGPLQDHFISRGEAFVSPRPGFQSVWSNSEHLSKEFSTARASICGNIEEKISRDNGRCIWYILFAFVSFPLFQNCVVE